MLYSEYITKAKSFCILINEENNMAYLIPDYRYILLLSGMKLSDVTDFPDLTMDIVGENLKLEVEAYNIRNDNARVFIDELRSLFTSVLSPLAVNEQNEIVHILLQQMQQQNERQQQNAKTQSKSTKKMPDVQAPNDIVEITNYMNLSKKNVKQQIDVC